MTDDSLLDALLADELDEKPCCTLALAWRPKRRLRRYRHHLWVCACGQAWRTKRGPYEKVTWLWRMWPESPEVGRCGERCPGPACAVFCVLSAGHVGWHRGDNGNSLVPPTEWTNPAWWVRSPGHRPTPRLPDPFRRLRRRK